MLKLKIRNVLTSFTNFGKRTVSKVTGCAGRFYEFLVIGWKLSRTYRTAKRLKDYLAAGWASGRKLTTIERGFTTLDSKYSVFLSDLEGSDINAEYKDFVDLAINDKKYWNCPIKIFCNSGVLGMYARCDYSILFVLEGVPLILSSRVRLEGTDEYDPAFKLADNSTIASLMAENSKKVVSLGFVDPNTDVTKFVSEYMQKNPAIPSHEISFDLVKSFAANDSMRYYGAIYRPGGYMYDIYTANRTVSRSIRPNKEFRDDPLNEVDKLPDGMEILLIGGEPDIVPIGTMANNAGFLFDVWVPNHRRYYKLAMDFLSAGCVPNDIFYFDDDDLIESYAILMKAMHVLDEEANGPSEDAETTESDTVPVITDESLDDNDEAPVLIELPEYLA